jgi:2,4-dienoyl-CoA reductase-like NADH-dependent reductase (Old Yellow Enzyme family)
MTMQGKEPGRDRYPHVFEPFRIGPVEISNRIYMAPHGIALETGLADLEYKVPSIEMAHYLAERAAGGVGLVFHSQPVSPVASYGLRNTNPWLPEALPSYRRVAEAVHERGGKIMAQLWYSGGRRLWGPLGPNAPALGASWYQNPGTVGVRREMTRAEIQRFIDDWGQATRNLREAGYDGIEVHASHQAIHEHFISPYFNRRTDEYGGSTENRLRFLFETLQVVRHEAGPALAVGVRISADEAEFVPTGYGPEEGTRLLRALSARPDLLDFVDVCTSLDYVTPIFVPKHSIVERVARVSAAARPLVVLTTPRRLTRIGEAEELLRSGIADMIGAVRGLIAEPELVRHALEGDEDRSRTCVGVNQCFEVDNGFGCALNPAAGLEERWGSRTLAPASSKVKLVVVGAGPGGLEAARAAALRGHEVTVLERRRELGGALALWARLPGCDHLAGAIRWWSERLAELGVRIELGVDAGPGDILSLRPDAILLATGARYSPTGDHGSWPADVPGWDEPFVHTPEDVLEAGVELRGRVLVVDEEGMHAGIGIAELAASRGAHVELITSKPAPAASLTRPQGAAIIPARLRSAGITVSTSTGLREIGDRRAIVAGPDGGRRTIEGVDVVVLATMRKPVDGLRPSLEGRLEAIYLIGDALAPRKLRDATYEGHRLGHGFGGGELPAQLTDALFEPMQPLSPAGRLSQEVT